VMVLGVVSATAYETEIVTSMEPGQQIEIAGYTVHYEGEEVVQGPNYTANRGQFVIDTPWNSSRPITSERRVYEVSGMPTTEAGINTYGFTQLYVQFGERFGETGRVVRLWHKPYVVLIWLGALIMSIAGFYSLSDRRLRIGAPARAKPKHKSPEPAE
jgi:cytochrome c-type biogenesis protein CcmF